MWGSFCAAKQDVISSTPHLPTLILIRCQRLSFCSKVPRNKGFPAIRLIQKEIPVAGFLFSSLVASCVFLHDSDRDTCIFTRFSRVPCKNTRFDRLFIGCRLVSGHFQVSCGAAFSTGSAQVAEAGENRRSSPSVSIFVIFRLRFFGFHGILFHRANRNEWQLSLGRLIVYPYVRRMR